MSIYLKVQDRFILKDWRGGASGKEVPIDGALIEILKQQGTLIVDELEYKILKDILSIEMALNNLKEHLVSVVVPIMDEQGFLGLIMLGEKNNHVVFSNRDVFVLNIMADYAAFAMRNAIT